MENIILQGITSQELLEQFDKILQKRIKAEFDKQERSDFENVEFRKGSEVCQFLGISPPTLSKYVKEGKITKYSFDGRPKYNTKEIAAYLIIEEQKRA